MGPLERYYSQTAALVRLTELLDKGKNVSIRRDKDDGRVVWKLEWS